MNIVILPQISQLPKEIWSIIIDFRTDVMLKKFITYIIFNGIQFKDVIMILSRDIDKTSDVAINLYDKYIDLYTNIYSVDDIDLYIISTSLIHAQDYLHDYNIIDELLYDKPYPELKVDLHGQFLRKLFIKDGYYSIKSVIDMMPEENDISIIVNNYIYGHVSNYYSFNGFDELKEYYDTKQLEKSIIKSIRYLLKQCENTNNYSHYLVCKYYNLLSLIFHVDFKDIELFQIPEYLELKIEYGKLALNVL